MDGSQARYEFRVWGERLDEPAARLRAVSEPRYVQQTAETYLVSASALDVNPKLRNGLMDVKRLIGVDDGFELWDVVFKAPFPIETRTLESVLLPLLGVTESALRRQAYSRIEFLDEVVAPHPGITAVRVEKRRHGYEVNGCAAEFAEVTIVDRVWQSVAVESTDLRALSVARLHLGLVGRENLSYPGAIRRMLGWAVAAT